MASKKGGGTGWAIQRSCPRCGWPEADCRCSRPAAPKPSGRPVMRIRLERRRGKPITVVAAEGLSKDDLRTLLRELKGKLATGGTLKGEELELQGDHRAATREQLASRGHRVKG